MTYKRQAGKSTREMANQRRNSALWVAGIGMGILVVVTLFAQNAKALGISGVGILALLVFVHVFGDFIEGQVGRKIKLEKQAIRGARAEEEVGELLDELPDDEYYVLHDIESPYGNIDHIVFAKNRGIFLLETKAHGGEVEIEGNTLFLNGELPEKNFVAQALQNSYWLRDKISEVVGSKPWITPVIVFTNAFVPPTKPIKGVYVVNKKYLLPLVRRTNRPNSTLTKVWEVRENIENELS
ncbi:MAG: hypothetical protein DDG60_03335 [Anaerolineae bacterium]|nr:MAG: hypothetical protein DDG60_03335 [Anaerolineae bacterium]